MGIYLFGFYRSLASDRLSCAESRLNACSELGIIVDNFIKDNGQRRNQLHGIYP